MQRPLVFQPHREDRLEHSAGYSASSSGGQEGIPHRPHQAGSSGMAQLSVPTPLCSKPPPLPVFIALMSMGAWTMRDGEEGALSPILRVKSGRTCQAQEQPGRTEVPAQRATPPPATAVESELRPDSSGLRARPASHRLSRPEAAGRTEGKTWGPKDATDPRESKRKKSPVSLELPAGRKEGGDAHQHTALEYAVEDVTSF